MASPPPAPTPGADGSRPAGRDSFDLVTVGSGAAAFAAAIRARGLGATVAMVEAATVGGTCVNVGCIPSKALLAAADSYRQAGEARFPGVATSQAGLDMAALVGGKDQVVAGLRQEKYLDLAAEYGFEIIRGRARFVGPGLLS